MKTTNTTDTTIETTANTLTDTEKVTAMGKMTKSKIDAMTSSEYGAYLQLKTVVRPVELSDLVRKYVDDSIEGIDMVAKSYEDYCDEVAMDSNEHAQYHANLMSLPASHKVIIASLNRLIMAEATKGNNYTDRNAVAKQLGNKLTKGKASKFFDQDGTWVMHNNHTKLSLGLNITEFLRREGIAHLTSMKSAEGHTIVKIEPGFGIPKFIKIVAAKVRSHMASTSIIDHTPTSAGGHACDPVTMLNSKGFNTNAYQPQSVCDVANKLQNVEYRLRHDLPADFLINYQTNARWEDDHGNFMIGEWNKFATDIQTLNGDPFKFAQAFDDRGRMYSRATYVALQGDSTQKAMLEFANKHVIANNAALDYLKVGFCNEAHTDKISTEDAVKWFDSKTDDELDAMADKRADGTPGSQDAYPALRGILNDYRAALAGEAIGTILPWDATNQGAQIYALLARDIPTALMSNVAYRGDREDAYGDLAAILNRLTQSTIFNRDNVKFAFMTYLYGAGKSMILHGYTMYNPGDTKTIEQSIGRFFPTHLTDDAKWDLFIKAMSELLPAAVAYMEVIYKFADEKRSKFNWVMPDGFVVETTTWEQEEVVAHYFKLGTNNEISSTPSGSIFAKRETGVAASKALAPNIIHSIDSYILREVVRRADFDIVTIHDSFGVHPNNVDRLRQLYREVMISVMEMSLLENILEQINPNLARVVARRGLLTKGGLEAEHINGSVFALR